MDIFDSWLYFVTTTKEMSIERLARLLRNNV